MVTTCMYTKKEVGTPLNHTATTSVNPIMKLGVDQLPFTMSGVVITGFNAWNTGAENNANDDISIFNKIHFVITKNLRM